MVWDGPVGSFVVLYSLVLFYRVRMVLCGLVRACMIWNGPVRSCSVLYGLVRSCLFLYGPIWFG